MDTISKILWTPSEDQIKNCNISKYLIWLNENHQLDFQNYDELWEWSVTDTKAFWKTIWDYFKIINHTETPSFVHSDDLMPDTHWFGGALLNYTEHIFRNKNEQFPALIFKDEEGQTQTISWQELEAKTAALADWLKHKGIKAGDSVVAYLPNIPEAIIAFLAASSIGAIWSSCSPDFGTQSVVERFQQIEPKIFFTIKDYQYNGKKFDKSEVVNGILAQLPTVVEVIDTARLAQICNESNVTKLSFTALPFGHPLYVLYSSGTTGIPKAITHGHGGCLLEHLKYLHFHNDIQTGERFFWFSTTGWMMWNMVVGSLLTGATAVLYDGSPAYPDLYTLWDFAEEVQINHFGTSAAFIISSMKEGIVPKQKHAFAAMRSVGSTGSPLPPEGFEWIYENVKKDIWLASISGGTDLCTAFVGGVPTVPVYKGEIQRRCLGAAVYAFDEKGDEIVGEMGEMVITKPMPSMPIYFWNDKNKEKYKASYFEMYEGIWRHGDWLTITDRHTLTISGRSDATLNRHGIRIGTAEIYRAIDQIENIKDSLIVNIENPDGSSFMPLFVTLAEGQALTDSLQKEIKSKLREAYSPRHVPDQIIQITEIPYTLSGKKLEAPIKKILLGIPVEKAANLGAMRNPNSLAFFENFAKELVKK